MSVDPQPRTDDPEVVIEDMVVRSVHDHLTFNVAAYGAAWTGEYVDSEFIAGSDIGAHVVCALEAAGWRLVRALDEGERR